MVEPSPLDRAIYGGSDSDLSELESPSCRVLTSPPRPPSPSLEEFCLAIRGKDNWHHKILDCNRSLGLKWAIEARLIDSESGVADDNVSAALRELESEARRIVQVDFNIPLNFSSMEPNSNVEDLDLFDSDIHAALQYAALGRLRTPALTEDVGVFVSDGLVPVGLHRELILQLDLLAQGEPMDFHPGSNGKVQDLIHPSLYPLVLGETFVSDPSKFSTLPTHNLFTTGIQADSTQYPQMFSSRYSWIPSVFEVSEDGTNAHIQSYINGLGSREHFPRLYRIIEKVFVLALPHLERTMNFRYKYTESPAVMRWRERYAARGGRGGGDSPSIKRSRWENLLKQQAEEKASHAAKAQKDFPSSERVEDPIHVTPSENSGPFTFRGRKLKVIVKAANYHMKAGDEYTGSWHMEGMPHERIVASVIYYYDTDKAIVDKGLKLRKGRNPDVDFPSRDEFYHEDYDNVDSVSDYPSDWESESSGTSFLSPYISLGSVPTTNFLGNETTGRMLSFPNWIQHQVGHLSVSDSADKYIAKRKILCFFLVDDDDDNDSEWKEEMDEDGNRSRSKYTHYHGLAFQNLSNRVLTTCDIPYQERMTNFRTLRFLLPMICRNLVGHQLPPELVQHILNSGHWGFTREDAEQFRRSLMKDRVKAKVGVAVVE
ncbi:hypothetical protein C8J57DRAFT_1216984 [Mycena rebaudengoi]|nr:hypothetical protein C8J57DRAFT_1216984 [Mycena rebaudengoi]